MNEKHHQRSLIKILQGQIASFGCIHTGSYN